ncbi:ABC transporter permease [Clostridium sp. MCC353]|uniref:ABC transporter permease n=1 Tax=Clostridium sp. MCC353 TaxID=2592646 RepID=UPI001C02122B|nr:ABC transporter permease [Clostridium sp. MCC353]MBT9779256.1 ABC transporter permease [Clostridium sp. MCC353]
MKLIDSIREKDIVSKCLIILAAILAALAIGAIFISILNVNPFEAYYYLLIRPFRNFRSIGEISIKLVPILIVGIGVSFTFQAKLSNLGGEGQICLGAIGMTLVGTSPLAASLGPWWIPVGMIVAALFGAFWAGIAGFFKTQFKASEIITTLLLNYIAVQFLSYCVYYPLRDPKGNIPQSAKVASTLPKLVEGSRMNAGILVALACVVVYWIVIRKTNFGYRLRVLGGSIKAAAFGGISQKKYYLLAMLLSGAFAGLAGSIEIAGTQTRLLEGLAGSYGFDGVVAALLGMLHPAGVLVSSILLAALSSGAETMQVKTGVSSLFLNVLEALIVLFILLGFSFFGSGKKKVKASGREKEKK